jgi:hypothetical protein
MFVHLDGDEYIYMEKHENIVDYINFINGWGKEIYMHWLLFGSNNLDTNPQDKSLIFNYNRCCQTKSIMGKTFVDPKILNLQQIYKEQILFPHLWNILPNKLTVDSHGNVIYINREKIIESILNHSYNCFNNKNNMNECIYVYHYIYQSWESYKTRKLCRNRDDLNCKRSIVKPIQGSEQVITDKNLFHIRYNKVLNNNLSNLYKKLLTIPIKSPILINE